MEVCGSTLGGAPYGACTALKLFRVDKAQNDMTVEEEQTKQEKKGGLKEKEDTGLILCSGYENGGIVFWDVNRQQMLSEHKIHESPVVALDVWPASGHIVTGSAEDDSISLCHYTATSYILDTVTRVKLYHPGLDWIQFRFDGKVFVVCGWDGTARLYKRSSGKLVSSFRYHSSGVTSASFSSTKHPNYLLTGSRDCTAALWEIP